MFWTLIFLAALFFILRPIIRGMWMLYRLRKQVNDMFGQSAGNRRQTRRDNPQQPAPPQKKKKITADVGEYVSFEEIEVTQTETTTGTETEYRQYTATSQVEDVEWEDVK